MLGLTFFWLWGSVTWKPWKIEIQKFGQIKDINFLFSLVEYHVESITNSEVICNKHLFLQPAIYNYGSVQENFSRSGYGCNIWKLITTKVLELWYWFFEQRIYSFLAFLSQKIMSLNTRIQKLLKLEFLLQRTDFLPKKIWFSAGQG